ncbi:NAD-dependent DNA ligase LigA [Nocardia sp. NPDC047648]|uniref:NAD-dependent DNA ligase LigA n=1 Tax=Nocardia sp. NPDC047648 TaxID=3155625 RepID=UPI0033E58392
MESTGTITFASRAFDALRAAINEHTDSEDTSITVDEDTRYESKSLMSDEDLAHHLVRVATASPRTTVPPGATAVAYTGVDVAGTGERTVIALAIPHNSHATDDNPEWTALLQILEKHDATGAFAHRDGEHRWLTEFGDRAVHDATTQTMAAQILRAETAEPRLTAARGDVPAACQGASVASSAVDTGQHIQQLAQRVVALREAYYQGEPLVADADYDALEDELRGLIEAHPDLTPDPNPLDRVGAPATLHAPVRHSRPMLSLEKATTFEQVAAFFHRFPGQPVVVMPKLDGLSLALVYQEGRLARAVTRGDGTTGDDVTVLVRALVDAVPERIDVPGRVEVRGEAVMLRSTFLAYNNAHPTKPLINPRNAAAGTLRAKDPATVAERRLQFFGFDLDTPADSAAEDLQEGLAALGITAADMRHCADAEQAQVAITAIERTRNDLDYDLDGAVLRLADRDAYAAAGTRSNSPRGALAFKFAAEEKTTVLVEVVWDVGKTGKIVPVALLEPVFVGGTTVTKATLANQEVIRARDIKIGDTVLVRRAGDVIPFVAGVLDASQRTGEEREIVPPTTCPSCQQPVTEQGNSRELFCSNVSCPAQTVRRLIHWASRAAADIDAIGPVWIERLAEAGLLESPADFYTLTKERLLEFDRIGEVSAARMIDSIDASRQVGMRRALIGLAIPMASEGTAARLARAGFRSLEEVADAGEERLVAVEDIGPKVAASLVAHLTRLRPELQRLRAAGVSLDVREEDLPPVVAADAPLAGKTVVITGAISDPRSGEKVARPTFQRLCEKAGATAASSVSANTDLLITGAGVGQSKLTRAQNLGVEIVDQVEIWKVLITAKVV